MADVTITVTDSGELGEAFERLTSGEGGTIRLEASHKPYVLHATDRGRPETDAPVRLVSADPDDPAVIAQMTLVSRENVTVENVVFDSSGTKRTPNHRDLDITASRNITVIDNEFRGEATEALDGRGQAAGVVMALVRESTDVLLSGNTVQGYYQGISLKDSDDVAYVDNVMTKLQGDAIRIAGVQDLLIEGNHLYGMLGTSQHINHSDMIQFWGTHIAQNTERVTIRNNLLNTADGPAYQMIFGGNEDYGKNRWLFEDIVIEGNVLFGAHHNMIAVGNTRDMVVRNNTVLWNDDAHLIERGGEQGASVNGWIRARNSVGTKIEDNIATNIAGATGRNGVVTYDDPSDASHHSHHFVNLDAGGSAELQDLSLRPDSPWNRKLGAPMTWSSHKVDDVTAVVIAERDEGDLSVVAFDASLSRDEGGRLGGGASYVWTFADGTTKRGQSVTHDFETAGEHRYALEVRSGGRTDRIERKVEIAEPELLRLTMERGAVRDASSYGSRIEVKGGKPQDGGFVLDGSSKIMIDRASEQLYSLDHFALTMSFTPAKAGASGVLFVLREAMQGYIRPDGAFKFTITTTEGRAMAVTEPGAFSGTEERDLAVVYDGGAVTIYVDGEEAASAAVTGITKPLEHWGLVIGNQWNASVKGVVSDVALSAEIDGLGKYAPPLVKHDGGSSAEGGGAPVLDGVPDEDAGSGSGSGGGQGAGSGGGKPRASDWGEALVHLDFDGGARDRSGNDAHLEWNPDAVRFVTGSDGRGGAVALGDRDDGVTISRWNPDLFGLDAFSIAFDLKREGTGSDGGRVLSLHRALDLSLGSDGRLAFGLVTDEGTAVARTKAGAIGTGWHAVEVSYASGEGLEIVVDGVAMAEAALSGITPEAAHWGLTLGRLWGGEARAFVDEFRFRGEGGGASPEPGPKPGSGGGTLVALDFEGSLADADGRGVGVRAAGLIGYAQGTDGRGVAIGEGSVLIARENDFLHELDSFGMSFDLRRHDASEDGRVLHIHNTLQGLVSKDGTFAFDLTTDEGTFRVETEAGAVSARGWHEVEIGYDDAAGRLRLSVDGEVIETRASGTTAEASHWGLTLGSAWGDTLGATIDAFQFSDAPGWA